MNYLKQFEYVAAVAQYESISRAADQLGIAQPTLSKYLQRLENELETELFDRSRVPIRLTQAGECFAAAGRQILDVDRQMKKRLRELKNSRAGEFRVGISPSRSPYLLPDILARFRKVDPSTQVRIEERLTQQLSEGLAEGVFDIVISLLDDSTAGFERAELFEERLLLAVGRELVCDDGATVRQMLGSLPLAALGKGQYLREVLDEYVPERSGGISFECQNIESAMSVVRAGLAAAIVPSYIKEYGGSEQNRSVLFFELEDLPQNRMSQRRVCLFYRREQFLSEAERSFIECAKQSAEMINETRRI